MTASNPSPEIPPTRVQASIGLVPRRTSHSNSARLGLVIAALLGVGDVILGASQLGPDRTIPPEISTFAIIVGVVTLVAVPFAWRGAGWATWLVVVVRLLSALSALPAFFTPDVPAGFVAGAATEVVLAVLVAVLLLIKPRRSNLIRGEERGCHLENGKDVCGP